MEARGLRVTLTLAAVAALVIVAVVMGFATGRWIPVAGLLFGVVPIGVYGLFIAVAGKRVAEQMEDDVELGDSGGAGH